MHLRETTDLGKGDAEVPADATCCLPRTNRHSGRWPAEAAGRLQSASQMKRRSACAAVRKNTARMWAGVRKKNTSSY